MDNIGKWEEMWMPIHFDFDFEYTNKFKLEISNWGNVRSVQPNGKSNILKGSMVEGYRVIKLKFHTARTAELNQFIDKAKLEIKALQTQKKEISNKDHPPEALEELDKDIDKLRKRLSNILKKDMKSRTKNHHFLVHRMVAQLFLPVPKEEQQIVGHIDFNKLNNKYDNLKWMTKDENLAHQRESPFVLADLLKRKTDKKIIVQGSKLSSTQVIHIKLLLKKNKTTRELAKKFKVSEMQIRRIKTGENWSQVIIP